VSWQIYNIANIPIIAWGPLWDEGLTHGFCDSALSYEPENPVVASSKLVSAFNLTQALSPNQTHSANVVDVNNSKSYNSQDADIIIANRFADAQSQDKTAVFIKTADCVPMILVSKDRIALVHAGWKGLSCGAIEAGLNLLNDPYLCLIGPAAESCCYEVGTEVLDSIGSTASAVKREGRDYLSTSKTAENIVRKFNSFNIRIERLGACTMCSAKFHSYRKTRTTSRNVSFAIVPTPTITTS